MAEAPQPGHRRGDARTDHPATPTGQVRQTPALEEPADSPRDEDIDFGSTGDGDSGYANGSNSTLPLSAIGDERARL